VERRELSSGAQPWGTNRDEDRNPEGVALTRRCVPSSYSIPNISLVDFDVVPFADLAELVLERHPLVVFRRIGNCRRTTRCKDGGPSTKARDSSCCRRLHWPMIETWFRSPRATPAGFCRVNATCSQGCAPLADSRRCTPGYDSSTPSGLGQNHFQMRKLFRERCWGRVWSGLRYPTRQQNNRRWHAQNEVMGVVFCGVTLYLASSLSMLFAN